MTDYTELIRSLRCENTGDDECGSSDCPYWSGLGCMDGQLMEDASDAIEELMKNLDMASQELSWTISYAMHLMRDIDELHDMVNEVYYDEL